MWIMVSGPYRSGSTDPGVWKQRLTEMNEAAFEVFKKGHTPIIGVNQALPVIEAAGQEQYESLMMPISLELARRCDAVLRIGGPSKGADDEVELFKKVDLPVYYHLDEIPSV